ncbi:hypothetical protein VTO73DRAFT_11484 [Trametes versicolor]
MKRNLSLYLTSANSQDGFGPSQRKKRSLNRRRFSYKSLHVGEDRVGSSHGQIRQMSDEAITTSTIVQSVLSDSRSEEPDVSMLPTPAHGTPLLAPPVSLADHPSQSANTATPVTSPEPYVPFQQLATTHTRGVQTAGHLELAQCKFAPLLPSDHCLSPSVTPPRRSQHLPSVSHMSGSVGALVQASWDSPVSSPPSSSNSAASLSGLEEEPRNVRGAHDDRRARGPSSITRDSPDVNTPDVNMDPRSQLSSSHPTSILPAMRSNILTGLPSPRTSTFLLLLAVGLSGSARVVHVAKSFTPATSHPTSFSGSIEGGYIGRAKRGYH